MSFVPGHPGPGTQLVLSKYRVTHKVHMGDAWGSRIEVGGSWVGESGQGRPCWLAPPPRCGS